MFKPTLGSAAALSLFLAACPALAEGPLASSSDEDIVAQGFRPDAHGPAGTMSDHVHKGGDLMIGMMWMHEDYGGANRRGTQAIDDQTLGDAGYATKAEAMTMDMAMLHIMYAPSDLVTLMLVPSWMKMGMTMKGLPASTTGNMSGMTGHMLMPGQSMSHSTEGIGDTQFGALISLSRRPKMSAHLGLMASAPTGSDTRKSANGSYVHYMMQGGSGTWDLNPSLTVHGTEHGFGWGAQVSYLWRTEDSNDAGFRFGDRFGATAWLSKPLSRRVSLSTRLAWSDEGPIAGHYNGPHSHASPADMQANYGGQKLEGSLGLNTVIGKRLRLGAELAMPLYQDLNGIQLPKRWGANVSTSVMF